MKRYELEEMNKEQLRAHAETAGVELGAEDTKGTMIDRILGEYKAPAAKAVAGSEPVPPVKKQPDMKEPPLGALYDLQGNKIKARMFEVEIFATANDSSPVPIIVNGHNVIVQRGKKVVLAEPYVEVLRNAVINTVVQDPDTGKTMPQRIQCYPFQAVPIAA